MLVIVEKKYTKKKESSRFRTCTFEKKTHLTKSSWKMPKHLMLVSHANPLGFLLNPRVASLYKFFRDQPMSSLNGLKSRKFHLVMYQSVTIHCHPSMGHTVDPKALRFLVVQNNRSFFFKKKENPQIHILVDWLNVKWFHCRYSKIVKWLNQAKHILWGSSRRYLQKIGWGCMSYHMF